jgi:hypothetical protein
MKHPSPRRGGPVHRRGNIEAVVARATCDREAEQDCRGDHADARSDKQRSPREWTADVGLPHAAGSQALGGCEQIALEVRDVG